MGMLGWRERQARQAEMMRNGDILRRLHWRCWRDVPAGDAPPVDVSLAELVEVLPVLIESGSVGLVWPRLAHRADELGAVGAAMQAGYEAQVAHNARVEGEIARVVELLRGTDAAAGVEPVLIKGYAMARLYPPPLVRTAGDIDLVVRDGEYEAAKEALAGWRGQVSFHGDPDARRAHARDHGVRVGQDRGAVDVVAGYHSREIDVDLHRYSRWYGAGMDEARFFATGPLPFPASVSAGATLVNVGGVPVLVPRLEDHLRALCLHFLRHGAVRPLRLCDIALLISLGMEAGPEGSGALDWKRVISGTTREREQIVVTLRLAEALLGAPLPPLPGALPTQLPAWLVPAVLRQWGENPQRRTPHVRELLGGPRAAYRALASRWPDPIMAVVRTGASFESRPGLQLKTYAFLKQGVKFGIWHAPEQVRQLVQMSNLSHNSLEPSCRSMEPVE